MNKLFYLLFLTPFLFVSCSDDDKEYFTRDIEYDIYARLIEVYNPTQTDHSPTPKYGIHITPYGMNHYAEGYYCKPQISYSTSGSTLHISCGILEYTKKPDNLAVDLKNINRTSLPPDEFSTWIPQVEFPAGISEIIITRKDAQDVYTVENTDNRITITPQKNTFTQFEKYKYQTRPENTFAVRFPNDYRELYTEFFDYVSATIPITIYEYDSTYQPLWVLMWYNQTIANIYRYENEEDYANIIRLFNEFCDEVGKDKRYFYPLIEDWTGKHFNYPTE